MDSKTAPPPGINMLPLLIGLTEGLILFAVLVIVAVVLLLLLAPRGQRVIARKPELEAAEAEEAAPKMAPPVVAAKPVTPAAPPPMVPTQLDRQIMEIEGIGPVYKEKLTRLGIKTVGDLLNTGKTRPGREDLTKETGASPQEILRWVNMADLFRIKGVGEEYSELLEASGVDTVVELTKRNPINLHPEMVKTNIEKKLVKRLPTLEQVRDWIEQARKLPRVVEY
mgnify:FL=1